MDKRQLPDNILARNTPCLPTTSSRNTPHPLASRSTCAARPSDIVFGEAGDVPWNEVCVSWICLTSPLGTVPHSSKCSSPIYKPQICHKTETGGQTAIFSMTAQVGVSIRVMHGWNCQHQLTFALSHKLPSATRGDQAPHAQSADGFQQLA